MRRLSAREQILIALGKEEGLLLSVPWHQFQKIILHQWRSAAQIARAYERAVEWAFQGRNDKDKRVRLAIIRFGSMRDAELAKHCFVDRQRINFLRQELWSILARAQADPSLKNDTFFIGETSS